MIINVFPLDDLYSKLILNIHINQHTCLSVLYSVCGCLITFGLSVKRVNCVLFFLRGKLRSHLFTTINWLEWLEQSSDNFLFFHFIVLKSSNAFVANVFENAKKRKKIMRSHYMSLSALLNKVYLPYKRLRWGVSVMGRAHKALLLLFFYGLAICCIAAEDRTPLRNR